jgi:hypothetical protein
MNRRPGITLTEALVALFVAALGMIALLTLFPLGALQMGQALKDSRCAQSAQEADGLMRWYWGKYETDPTKSPIQLAMDHSDASTNPIDTLPNSYPVFVDPIGAQGTTWPISQQATRVANLPVAANQPAAIPRRTVTDSMNNYTPLLKQTTILSSPPRNVTLAGELLRFCALQDDLTYSDQKTGAPSPQAGGPSPLPNVERGARYTWGWMLQRPNKSNHSIINMTVLVFDQRAPFYANSQTEVIFPNTASTTPVQFTPGSTSLTINYTGSPRPVITRGRWIMDGTRNANNIATQPLRHANFYRVASVNDDTPGVLYLELETPIRPRNDGSTAAYTGDLIVFNGLAEVFERPALITGNTP